jgi:acetyl-CoA acetyltransferase
MSTSTRRFVAAGKVAAVGVGLSTIYRRAPVPLMALALEACQRALADAGLTPDQIDGLATYPALPVQGAGSRDGEDIVSVFAMRRALGVPNLSWWMMNQTGGLLQPLLDAVSALAAGLCRYVLLWRALHNPTGRYGVFQARTASGEAQFKAPYGFANAVQDFAVPYQRYMARYGATRAHMATFIVQNRQNANRIPYAYWCNTPLSREDYLNAPYVAEPLSLLDCDLPVDGCGAVVLTTAERARDLPQPPAYVLGGAQSLPPHNTYINSLENIYEGGRALARALWEGAGLTARDIGAPQLYDGFSPLVYYWLEVLGFCGEGEAFAFIQDGRIAPDGELPLNSGSGNLGLGRLHGFPHLLEAILQAAGRAGDRQLPRGQLSLATATTPSFAGAVIFGRAPSV